MQLTAKERLVLALDVDDFKKAEELVSKLNDYVGVFKIGSQLFTAEGTKVVNMINERGGKVFLDLKFHDIPNTVARAAEVATKLGVYIFNVHTSGGYEMMKAAAEASKKISLALGIRKPLILGVTLLTSINQEILEKELGLKKKLEEQVVHLAKLAKDAGLDGVVASSREIKEIRKACGEDFVILTPGIRPAGKSSDDQKRIMTPREAIKLGADFLVIGRPIRNASNPVEAAKEILKEMGGN
ncbi:MAG TPA: orotidine-5'-phosphate decarboxylase [Candidatus Atribacteria bacterium]|nr:MAG: Orotidine 5'-phosphate decarboxylase [Atribacteria bacterium 34_128]HAJ33649.1 orotidine-5'-phosphate decarboxylase [Candidatus Atribacteria bacterium]